MGDIDGDGIPEIHVVNLGGGANPGRYLLRQDEEGRYTSHGDPGSSGGYFSTFFDLGGDGSQDLFLGPVPTGAEVWQHLVLVNDGTGNFTRALKNGVLMPSAEAAAASIPRFIWLPRVSGRSSASG